MANTFDIRFARSAGLAALFESPENSFGWKGGGRLSIDAAGASVVLSRGVLSLLARQRSQRIPADCIREVYREGDALRVEFALEDKPRTVLPFWARDRETAAQIVHLLPTSRTIEIEDGPAAPRRKSGHLQLWPVLGVALVGIGVVLFVALKQSPSLGVADTKESVSSFTPAPVPALSYEIASSPDVTTDAPSPTSTSTVAATSTAPEPAMMIPAEPAYRSEAIDAGTPLNPPPARRAVPAATSNPSSATEPEVEGFVPSVPPIRVSPGDMVVPLRQGTLAYDTARSLLARFEEVAAKLSEGYRSQRNLADSNRISPESFADSLDSYAAQWRDLKVKLLQTREAMDPALTGFSATLLAVVRYQDSFLTAYAAAVRSKDLDAAMRAFGDLTRADEMLERARLYLR